MVELLPIRLNTNKAPANEETGIVLAVILFLYLGLSILGSVLIMHIPRLPVNVSPSSVSLTYEEVSFSERGDSLTLKGLVSPRAGERCNNSGQRRLSNPH